MFSATPVYKAADDTVVFGLRQPAILPAAGDVLVQVTDSTANRLDVISFRLLNDASAWWAIADCNNMIDPLAGVTTGLNLRVPSAGRLPS